MQEAYLKGVSTRKVDDLVQAMGMSGLSKCQVSLARLEPRDVGVAPETKPRVGKIEHITTIEDGVERHFKLDQSGMNLVELV